MKICYSIPTENCRPRNNARLAQIYFNGTRWVVIENSRCRDNKVMFSTTHLTKFAAVIITPTKNFSDVLVYPNPYRPSRPSQKEMGIIIGNMPANSDVWIYTLAGNLVRQLKDDDGDGQLKWDAQNGNGQDVASGVYFGLLKDNQGKKVVKIAVQR